MMVDQKAKIEADIKAMKKRLEIVEYKVRFYRDLMNGKQPDTSCNPMKVMPEQMRMQKAPSDIV